MKRNTFEHNSLDSENNCVDCPDRGTKFCMNECIVQNWKPESEPEPNLKEK
jgi:hypothetical protein